MSPTHVHNISPPSLSQLFNKHTFSNKTFTERMKYFSLSLFLLGVASIGATVEKNEEMKNSLRGMGRTLMDGGNGGGRSGGRGKGPPSGGRGKGPPSGGNNNPPRGPPSGPPRGPRNTPEPTPVPTPAPTPVPTPAPIPVVPGVTRSVWQDGTAGADQISTSTLVGDTLVLAGFTTSTYSGTSAGRNDAVAVGFASSQPDVPVWTWQGGSSTNDEILTSTTIDSNTFILGGYSIGDFDDNGYIGSKDAIAICMKILADNSVVELWRWQGGTTLLDDVRSSTLIGSTTVVLVGHTSGDFDGAGNRGSSDVFAVAIDFSSGIGVELWRWQDGTSAIDQAFTSTLIDSNTLVIGGHTTGDFDGNGNTGNDAFAVGIDISSGVGVTTWKWQGGSVSSDTIETSVLVDSNTVVFSGTTQGDFDGEGKRGSRDAFSVAIDRDGGELWRWQDGSISSESVKSSVLVGSNTLILSGTTYGDVDGDGTRGREDAFAIGIDMSSGDGVTMWKWQDGTSLIDRIETSVLIDSNTLVIGGTTLGNLDGNNKGDRDFASFTIDV